MGFSSNDPLTALVQRDGCLVYFLTSVLSLDPPATEVELRHGPEIKDIPAPQVAVDYNSSMVGVDVADRLRSS